MMYLSLSGLRSNYEGESRIHVCAFAKSLVSQGCLPDFPTLLLPSLGTDHRCSGEGYLALDSLDRQVKQSTPTTPSHILRIP